MIVNGDMLYHAFIIAMIVLAILTTIALIVKITRRNDDNGLRYTHEIYKGDVIRYTQGGKQHK